MKFPVLRTHSYPARLLGFVSRSLGAYLFYYSLVLIPYARLLYSNQGLIPSYTLMHVPAWSTLWSVADAPGTVVGGLVILSLLGLALLLGSKNYLVPTFAWILYASFQNRNTLSNHPGTDVIGFVLIFILLARIAAKLYVTRTDPQKVLLPSILYDGSWIAVGLAFTASGLARLAGDSWFSGSGIADMFSIMPIRTNFLSQYMHSLFISAPHMAIAPLTYFADLTFIFALPLSLFKQTRPFLLVALIAMYTIVLIVADMSQVILPLLILFLLLSDVLLPYGKYLPHQVRTAFSRIIRYRFSRSS